MSMRKLPMFMLLGGVLLACGASAGAAPQAGKSPEAAPPSGSTAKPTAKQTSTPATPSGAKSQANPPASGAPSGAAARGAYQVEVKTLTAQPVVVIRGSAPADELETKLATVFPRLLAFTVKEKLEIAGPPFVRYELASGTTTIEFEAGLPVYKAPSGAVSGDIQVTELPAGPAAVTEHQGPYTGLPAAHAALAAWSKTQGRAAKGASWVVFVTNPLMERNPAKLRTKVFLPLAR